MSCRLGCASKGENQRTEGGKGNGASKSCHKPYIDIECRAILIS